MNEYVSPMDTYYQDGVARPFIQIGENVWVADNSGVKRVRIYKWLAPSVYLVKVTAVRVGYEKRFPLEQSYAAYWSVLKILAITRIIRFVCLRHIIY